MMMAGDYLNLSQMVAEEMAANGGKLTDEAKGHLCIVLADVPREVVEGVKDTLRKAPPMIGELLAFLDEFTAERQPTDPAPPPAVPVPVPPESEEDFETSAPVSVPPEPPEPLDDGGHGTNPSRAQQLRRRRR